jgi:hypothetical protein
MAQETPGKRDDKSQWDGAKKPSGPIVSPKDGGKHSGGGSGGQGGKKK